MREVQRTVLSVVLAIWLGFPAVSAAETLHLQQCVDKAFAHSKTLQMEAANVKAAEAKIREARGNLLPQVNANATYTYSPLLGTSVFDINIPEGVNADELGLPSEPIAVEFGAPHNGAVGVTLQQPLFAWGVLGNSLAQAKASLEATRQGFLAARQQLRLKVTETFYDVLLTQELVSVTGRAVEQIQKHRGVAAVRLSTGATTKFDVLRAEVELANARTQHIQATNNLELAKENLKLLLDMPTDEPIEVVGTFDAVQVQSAEFRAVPDVQTLIEEAIQRRPDLLQLRFQELAGEKRVHIAKAGNKPNIGLASNYQFQQNNRQSTGNHSFNMMVTLNVPIFNGFKTKAQVEGAEMGLEQTRLGREQLEDIVRLEVKTAYLNLQKTQALIQAQGETVTQASEGLRIANVQYENGMLTPVEFTDTQLALTQAEVNQIQALHGYATAYARLEKAVGRPISKPATELAGRLANQQSSNPAIRGSSQ
ncbi:TolC family protein [Candidatus Poribacteria bacterium]|nr:TolC family protein [Candidatus Poribacteria bacterium]